MVQKIKKHGKIVLILGLVATLLIMYLIIPISKAGVIDNRMVTLSDSRDDAAATSVIYDFEGDTSGTVRCIKMQFCDSAESGGTCNLPTGLVTTSSAIYNTAPFTWATFDSTQFTLVNSSNGTTTLTMATGTTGAADSSWVLGSITNPTTAATTSYVWISTYSNVDCATGPLDSGVAAFRIIEGVAVQATVVESLSATVSTVAAGSCTGDSGTCTAVSTSAANAVNFGTLITDQFKTACHQISVTTNSSDGYSLTTQETTNMKKESNVLIADTTCGAVACTEATFKAWSDADLYPGFGHSCENVTNVSCNATYDFAGTPFYRQFACVGADADCDPGTGGETASAMMATSTPGTTVARIHYKIGITGSETAGTYSNEVVYIVTPTY